MVVKTFSAQVKEGRLQHDESLAALEGQAVQVTVVAQKLPPAAPEHEEASVQPPEWLEVENDVCFKMPRRLAILKNVQVIDGGRMRPCIILPEELPDE